MPVFYQSVDREPVSASPRRARHVAVAIATLARYTAAEAVNSRVAVAALLVIATGIALGQFAGELALTDTVALRVLPMAWIFRLAAVFLLASFTISSVVRDHHDKGLELLLALPMPRWVYLAGKFGGAAAAALALAILFGMPLAVHGVPAGALAWSASLALEGVLVVGVSLWCALTFAHVVASFAAVAAFYALARTMGALIAIGGSAYAPTDSTTFTFASTALRALDAILPRLDLFGRGQWLIDGTAAADLWPLVLQSAIGTTLFLAAAAFDLARRSV